MNKPLTTFTKKKERTQLKLDMKRGTLVLILQK